MIRIAQISDLHLVDSGELLYDERDTSVHFSHVTEELNRIKPAVDLVLMTGDLVDHPKIENYMQLKNIASRLQAPYYVLPGNHDDPQMMINIFKEGGHYPDTGPTRQYAIECGNIQILMLNSHHDHTELADYNGEKVKWLKEALEKCQKPTMLAIHHPPMITGIPYVDMAGDWFKPIADLINEHSHVELIICGHAHCDLVGMISGVPVYMMSSQAHLLECARDMDVAPSFIRQSAPAVIHSWSAKTGFLSGPCPWPKDADENRIDKKGGLNWQQIKDNMRKQ